MKIGTRVEIHPSLDLWMMGARFGDVIGQKPDGRVWVHLDRIPGKKFAFKVEYLKEV